MRILMFKEFMSRYARYDGFMTSGKMMDDGKVAYLVEDSFDTNTLEERSKNNLISDEKFFGSLEDIAKLTTADCYLVRGNVCFLSGDPKYAGEIIGSRGSKIKALSKEACGKFIYQNAHLVEADRAYEYGEFKKTEILVKGRYKELYIISERRYEEIKREYKGYSPSCRSNWVAPWTIKFNK